MLNVKIHGISQETRPVTCVLGLEGIALLITHGLVALFVLFYFPNSFSYACCLYCRSPLLLYCSFFASGSAECSSGCFAVPVVALVILSLGCP
jgi:hypothetical protein